MARKKKEVGFFDPLKADVHNVKAMVAAGLYGGEPNYVMRPKQPTLDFPYEFAGAGREVLRGRGLIKPKQKVDKAAGAASVGEAAAATESSGIPPGTFKEQITPPTQPTTRRQPSKKSPTGVAVAGLPPSEAIPSYEDSRFGLELSREPTGAPSSRVGALKTAVETRFGSDIAAVVQNERGATAYNINPATGLATGRPVGEQDLTKWREYITEAVADWEKRGGGMPGMIRGNTRFQFDPETGEYHDIEGTALDVYRRGEEAVAAKAKAREALGLQKSKDVAALERTKITDETERMKAKAQLINARANWKDAQKSGQSKENTEGAKRYYDWMKERFSTGNIPSPAEDLEAQQNFKVIGDISPGVQYEGIKPDGNKLYRYYKITDPTTGITRTFREPYDEEE
jgi:hypothetical protein